MDALSFKLVSKRPRRKAQISCYTKAPYDSGSKLPVACACKEFEQYDFVIYNLSESDTINMIRLTREARESIRSLLHSFIISVVRCVDSRPVYSISIFFIGISCYSSALFRSLVFYILVLVGIWTIFSVEETSLRKSKLIGKTVLGLVRESSTFLLPQPRSPAKTGATASKPQPPAQKIQISIPLAPKTERALLDFVAALSKSTIEPIISTVTHGDKESPLLDTIESAIGSALSDIGQRSSSFDFANFVSFKLVPKVTRHFTDCRIAAVKASRIALSQSSPLKPNTFDEALLLKCYKNGDLHPALKSWKADDESLHKSSELEYLKLIATNLLPRLFEFDCESPIFRAFVTEMFAAKLLKPVIDMFADADYWNQIFDSLGDQVISQEHILAKRIAEAVEKQLTEEHDDLNDHSILGDSEVQANPTRISALLSAGAVGDLLDEIKACKSIIQAEKIKECILNDISFDKARKETLLKGNYADAFKVKELKNRIKMSHKLLRRANRRIRTLKRKKIIGNAFSDQIPSLDDILATPVLLPFFQEFCSQQHGKRPDYTLIWTNLQRIEDKSGLLVESANSSGRLSTGTMLESRLDLTDYYDTEDISVSFEVLLQINEFLEKYLTATFWMQSKSILPDPAALERDINHLHDVLRSRLEYLNRSAHLRENDSFDKSGCQLLLNDLEPIWKLRHYITDELEATEYPLFCNSKQCSEMLKVVEDGAISPNEHDEAENAPGSPIPSENKRKKRWTKLHQSKRIFRPLSWLKKKERDGEDNYEAEPDQPKDDEYIKSYIMPLKDSSDEEASEDELPWRMSVFNTLSAEKQTTVYSSPSKKRQSFDLFSFQNQLRDIRARKNASDGAGDLSSSDDDVRGFGIVKKLKNMAMEELCALSRRKNIKRSDVVGLLDTESTFRQRCQSPISEQKTVEVREHFETQSLAQTQETECLIPNFGRKRVSSASIETIAKPKPLNRLQSQSLEQFPTPSSQPNKFSVSMEKFNRRFTLNRNTRENLEVSVVTGGDTNKSSTATLKEASPANSLSVISALRRNSSQNQSRKPSIKSDVSPVADNPASRRSSFAQVKSAAKGILQKVTGAETMKSFRSLGRRKKNRSDIEAESSGYDTCADPISPVLVSESNETVQEEFDDSEVGECEERDIPVSPCTIDLTGTDEAVPKTHADMLLPSLTTPRIIELEELVESTKSELEDVQEHITNAAQFELSLNRIRALNLMKSGLEVEIKRLEAEKKACKERDIENLISPNSTSVKVTCTEAPKELVLFNIEVHLINTEGEKSGWIIQRNYSEFMDLHQKLKAKFPSTANQYEAPSKKIFKSVLKFRKRFVETRRKALEDYLQNLLKHTEICKSVEFRLFICHSDIVRLLYSTDSVPSETKKPKTKKQFVKNLFLKFEENIKRHAVKPQSRFNSVALTSEESAAQKLKIDSNGSDTVDVLFDLITEIFELKEKGNFIRRKALNLVLQHILGGAIERRVSEGLKSIVTEDAMAMRIQSLKESIFNSVWSVRTPELKAKTRQASSSKMTHLSLALLGKVVGKKNARRGALKFLWVFQNSVLNRQLIYMILDDLLEALYT